MLRMASETLRRALRELPGALRVIIWACWAFHGALAIATEAPRAGLGMLLGASEASIPSPIFLGEVFMGTSELLNIIWFFNTFTFRSVGPLSFLKRSLLFCLPGGPRDAGGRQEAGFALSWRSVRVLKAFSVCVLGSMAPLCQHCFHFGDIWGSRGSP